MTNVTAICYLSSLLFFGLGFSKMLVLKNAVIEYVNTYDYTNNVSLATGYFVLAIFFAVIGSLFFYVKNNREPEIIQVDDIEFRGKAVSGLDNRRRTSIPEVKAKRSKSVHTMDLERRMSF